MDWSKWRELTPWEKHHHGCHHHCGESTIPIIYDEGLSIPEKICRLFMICQILNNNLDVLREQLDKLPEMVKQWVDETVADALDKAINDHLEPIISDIDALKTQISGIENQITSINDHITDLIEQDSALENKINGIVSQIDTIMATLTTINEDVTDTKNSLNALSSTVAGHTNQLNDINTTLGTINTTLSGHTTQITNINTEITEINQNIDNLLSAVGSINDAIGNLQKGAGYKYLGRIAITRADNLGTSYNYTDEQANDLVLKAKLITIDAKLEPLASSPQVVANMFSAIGRAGGWVSNTSITLCARDSGNMIVFMDVRINVLTGTILFSRPYYIANNGNAQWIDESTSESARRYHNVLIDFYE